MWAINLRDLLVRAFGEGQVFFDVDSMDAGLWRAQIEDALERSTVVVVLIGPRWTSATDPEGRKRLFLTDDVHRHEVAYALERPGVTVIPVLVDGARLPRASDLPENLRGLTECQVSEIGDARETRAAGLRRLTRIIDDLLGQRRQRRRAAAAASATAVAGVANTLVVSDSLLVAAAFLVTGAALGAFSFDSYRRMARGHMKGAWVALIAALLSAAILVGSMARIAARMAQPAQIAMAI